MGGDLAAWHHPGREHPGGARRPGRFLGFRGDAADLIAGLDILAVPSRSEGTPLVVGEAMAAGVPVVASRVGGLPDQVTHLRTGLVVDPEDPKGRGDSARVAATRS